MSKKVVELLTGVLTEQQKVSFINQTFTSQNLKNSEFVREYREVYEKIDGLYDYELTKSEIDLRNILSHVIIPQSVYEQYKADIVQNLNIYRNSTGDKLSRLQAKEAVLQYTVSIPNSFYKKAAICEVLCLDKIQKYRL